MPIRSALPETRSPGRRPRTLVALATVLVIAGCSAGSVGTPRASPTPTFSASPTVSPSVSPSAPASPTASVPPGGRWEAVGSMAVARGAFHALPLLDGRVLVLGNDEVPGGPTESSTRAELYDPATRSWSAAARLPIAREGFVAIRLADGRVLVAGGVVAGGGYTADSRLFDPSSGSWSATGVLTVPRFNARAAVLADGRVLVVGGAVGATATSELFDPASGRWTRTGSLPVPYGDSVDRIIALPDGNAVLLGSGIYRYSVASDTWRSIGHAFWYNARSVLLADGRVLIAGSATALDGAPLADAWLLDPAPGTVRAAAPLPSPQTATAAVRLADGRVLLAGGVDRLIYLPSGTPDPSHDIDWTTTGVPHLTDRTLIYDPVTDRWSVGAALPTARRGGQAVLLGDGTVLLAGGFGSWPPDSTDDSGTTPTATAVLYIPSR